MEACKRKKIIMYHTKEGMVGGPTTYINNIVNSPLAEQYDFIRYYQNCAPRGINIPLLKRIVKDFKVINPDIVHVHGLQSEGFYGVLAARLAGCKQIITTIHGFAFDNIYTSKIKRCIYRWMVEPITIRMSTKVYCVCNYANNRTIVNRNAKRNRCNFILNPAPEMIFVEDRETVRKSYLFEKDDVVFAISGRIVKDKGFDLLAKIVKSINEKGYSNFKLLVIGDGEYRKTFEHELEKEIAMGQVVITGQTDRVADFLMASDAFVFPSYHENLPISLLEAGKCGLPCVASNVGGIPEIIIDDFTGFIINGHSLQQYVEKIIELIDNTDLRKKMSRNIRTDITERFSMQLFCERMNEIYK